MRSLQPHIINDITYRVYAHGSEDYKKALMLRRFVLGLSPGVSDKDLSFVLSEHPDEINHICIGAFLDSAIVGTLNLEPTKSGYLLRQLGVDPGMRGKNIGMELMRCADECARETGAEEIALHARLNTVGFYFKAGYVSTGKLYVYPSITLIHMYKKFDKE